MIPLRASELRVLVAHAAPFHERWDGAFTPRRGQARAIIEERLQHWIELAAGGDATAFERRLALDGLDRRSVRTMLGELELRDGHPMPAWTRTVTSACAIAGRVESDGDTELPFAEVIEPFVAHAGQALHAAVGPALQRLDAEAIRMLNHGLRRRLAMAAGRRILVGFGRYLGSSLDLEASASSRDGYDSYVTSMRDGGLSALLQQAPVLARMLAVITDAWVGATSAFVTAVAADAEALGDRFGGGTPPGLVRAVVPTHGNEHDGGRSVVLVTFASGLRLAYKPRDLAVAEQFATVCEWLSERAPGVGLRGLRVLRRGDHGWMEYAEPRACADQSHGPTFYRRAGSLLCMAWLLGAVDMHAANLVTSGEQPYLVDLETLLHPTGTEDPASGLARTGMLPAGGSAVDMSALGGHAGQALPVKVAQWHDLGSDGIGVKSVQARTPPLRNAPIIDGNPLSARDHVGSVLEGFELAYAALLRHREALRHAEGPLAGFGGLRVCFVLRPAQIYGTLLERLTHPRFLHDGIDRSIEIDRLAAPMLTPEVEMLWPLVRAEHDALERADIPRFRVSTSGAGIDVDGPDHVLSPMAATLPQAFDRLAQMSTAHRDQQLIAIRSMLGPRNSSELGPNDPKTMGS